jgi:flagellar basal body-associated protein FliL
MADTEKMMKQIVRIEEKLDRQISRAKKSQTTTVVIGVVLVLVMIGYFSWAGSQVRTILEPQGVAQMGSEEVVKMIREYRPEVEKVARERAPEMVDELVTELITNQLPRGRAFLQEELQKEAVMQLDSMTEYIIDEFNTMMDTHEDNIKQMAKDLQTTEGMQAFEDEMYNQINEALNDDEIAMQLELYGQALEDVRKTLDELTAEDIEMTRAQKATYDLIAVTRELASRSDLSLDDLPTFKGVDEAMQERFGKAPSE